jgi:hypothetical protein
MPHFLKKITAVVLTSFTHMYHDITSVAIDLWLLQVAPVLLLRRGFGNSYQEYSSNTTSLTFTIIRDVSYQRHLTTPVTPLLS